MEATESRLDFLTELDKKLTDIHKTHSDFYGEGIHLGAKDYKMTEEEIKEVLSVIESEDLIIRPENIGFGVGYMILTGDVPAPGLDPEIKRVLTFRESQLPEGHNFDTLSQVFLSERNFQLMRFYGMNTSEVTGNKQRYEY